jgi:uncharacterized membrane protein
MKQVILIILLLALLVPVLSASGLRESIQKKVDKFQIADEFKVFLIAMIPIFELRGAIPIGVLGYKLPLWKVFPIAVAGNMIPIFLILLFFDLVNKICFKIPFLRKLLESVFARTRRKGKMIEKYEELGLMLFVAIPLPVTGAWTGSLAAYLFGLEFWKSVLFIFLGVLIAGVVVSFLTSLKWWGALIAAAVILFLVIKSLFKNKQSQ